MSQSVNNKNYPHNVYGDNSSPISLSNQLKKKYRRNREAILGYSILSPMILLFLIFSVFPIFFVIYLSFTEWNGVLGFPKWIGIENYNKFFTADDYLITLTRAGFYGIVILIFSLFIGFIVALLLNQKIKGAGIIRTIWYLPTLVTFAVISQMVVAILNPVNGVSKQIMIRIGMEPIIFQQSAIWMSFWIILISIWKGIGGVVIIYLAGLQGIDYTLYEAAKVDGANKFRLLWNITIPSLRPITMFLLITMIIGSFQIFDPVYLISHGGPIGKTNIILMRIYQDAFQSFQMGMASASSVVVLVVTLILAIIQYRISQRNIT